MGIDDVAGVADAAKSAKSAKGATGGGAPAGASPASGAGGTMPQLPGGGAGGTMPQIPNVPAAAASDGAEKAEQGLDQAQNAVMPGVGSKKELVSNISDSDTPVSANDPENNEADGNAGGEDEGDASDDTTSAGDDSGDGAGSSALGQGGTSMPGMVIASKLSGGTSGRGVATAGGAEDSGESGVADGSLAKTAGKAAAAGAATAGASQALFFIALLNYLKQLWAAVQAIMQNFFAMVMAFAGQVFNSAVSFAVGVGASVANALGLTALAGAVATGATATLSILAMAAGLFGFLGSNSAQQSAQTTVDCRVGTAQQAAAENGDPVGIDLLTLRNAQTVYSVLGAWGMSDTNIAGILGNWEAESRIDPTSVQGMFATPFKMTDEKLAGATNNNNGIGLGQWTFGRNDNLRSFATAAGTEWFTIETQLSFMLSTPEGGNAQIVRDMIATEQASPGEAALFFHDKWERSADTEAMAQRRAEKAEAWFGMMGGWEYDQTLADSLLAQAGTTISDADVTQVNNAASTCRGMDTVNVALQDGGMVPEDAQALVDLYNEEGDAFLDERYGQYGGPGSCGTDHAMNCVSFSTYFLNKYTTFQTYPQGNGIRTAYTVAERMGKKVQSMPAAYSVGSGPGTGAAGHTLVVLAVTGDQVIVGEAGYCAFGGRVRIDSAARMKSAGWVFVDMTDEMLAAEDVKTL